MDFDCLIYSTRMPLLFNFITCKFGLVRFGAEDAAEGRLPVSSIIVIDVDKRLKLQMMYPSSIGLFARPPPAGIQWPRLVPVKHLSIFGFL